MSTKSTVEWILIGFAFVAVGAGLLGIPMQIMLTIAVACAVALVGLVLA